MAKMWLESLILTVTELTVFTIKEPCTPMTTFIAIQFVIAAFLSCNLQLWLWTVPLVTLVTIYMLGDRLIIHFTHIYYMVDSGLRNNLFISWLVPETVTPSLSLSYQKSSVFGVNYALDNVFKFHVMNTFILTRYLVADAFLCPNGLQNNRHIAL